MKKRKAAEADESSAKSANGNNAAGNAENDDHTPLTLDEIKASIKDLCAKVPTVPPEGIDAKDSDAVRAWALKLQAVIEEFNLLLCCVAAATYKWGTDRSGAADQNLSLLSSDLGNAQDMISSYVSPRISNVLAPVVDLVESKCIKRTDPVTGEEIKIKEYSREVIDPGYLDLCRGILCRNANMLRHVVLTSFHKVDRVITDYQKTSLKDSEQDRSLSY